jgi:O-antigen ligase
VADDGSLALDPLRLALAAFVILTISNVHMYIRPIAALRPGILLWLFVIGYPILVPKAVRWANVTSAWPARVFVGLGVIACLSVPFGISIGGAGSYLLNSYGRVLLLGLVLVIGIRSVAELRTIIWAYVLSIAIIIILALTVMDVQAAPGGIARLQSERRYDSNDLGVLFMIGLPLSIILFLSSRAIGKALSGFVMLGVPVMVAMSGSRGALVGLVGVAIAFLLGVRIVPFWQKIAAGVVALIVINLAAPEGYWNQMRTIIQPGDDYNLTDESGRKQVAQRGIGYMIRYPVFGVGVGNFGLAEATMSPLLRNYRPGDRMYVLAPHNTWLEVGAELGLAGLTLWIGMFIGVIVSLARLSRRLPSSWRTGTADQRLLYYAAVFMPLAFVGFAVPSTFVSHAHLPGIYLLLACLAALLECSRSRLRSMTPRASWNSTYPPRRRSENPDSV